MQGDLGKCFSPADLKAESSERALNELEIYSKLMELLIEKTPNHVINTLRSWWLGFFCILFFFLSVERFFSLISA